MVGIDIEALPGPSPVVSDASDLDAGVVALPESVRRPVASDASLARLLVEERLEATGTPAHTQGYCSQKMHTSANCFRLAILFSYFRIEPLGRCLLVR